MDRALKERIIGAIVLVAFVVLVVPVFLDGRPNADETVTETVPLPGQESQPVKVVVLDRDRAEPIPTPSIVPPADPDDGDDRAGTAAAVPETPPVEAQPASVADERPDDEPVARAAPADSAPEPSNPPPKVSRSTDSDTGMWAVQLGSFSNENNANRLAADLRQKGFAAFLSKTRGGGAELHRVRIGPQKDRPAAEAMAARLESAGHKGQVVPHP